MPTTKKLQKAVDDSIQERIDDGFRSHLGASIIGRECARQIWYEFMWAKRADHSPRIQRLFDRGNREEDVFVEHLRSIGAKVWTHNPKTGEQFRIKDINSFFQGSLDGVAQGLPELPDEYVLTEFKTHNDKSFKELLKKGVEKSKFEHYIQGMIYAAKKGFKWVLYCAVNKNDDELYFEYYRVKKQLVKKYIDRAEYIIYADEPPPRMARTKTHFKCKFCRHREICWNKEIPAINCRTCGWSEIRDDHRWHCGNPEADTEELDVKKGCPQHMFDPGMLTQFKPEFVATKEFELLDEKGKPSHLAQGYLRLDNDGKKIKHSPKHVTSEQLFKRFNK